MPFPNGREIKRWLKMILHRTGFLPLILGRRPNAFVLMFHEICDSGVSEASLEGLLDYLGRVFQFRSLDDLPYPSRYRDRPTVFLTFDDGLRNNVTRGYPILKRRGIPATFFVCPALVESGDWVWTYDVRERLRGLQDEEVARLSSSLFGRPFQRQQILDVMLGMPIITRAKYQAKIGSATANFSPNPSQRDAFEMMTWHDIRGLDPGLITIGSHSMTHAMLDSLEPEEAEYEIVASRKNLEQALDREIIHFCYPNGRIGHRADQLVRETYSTAVTTERYLVPSSPIDLHMIPRIGVTRCVHEQIWDLVTTTLRDRSPLPL